MVMEIFCILALSMSISWFWYWTIALQDVTLEGNRVKDIGDFSILFLRNACKYAVVSCYNI